MRTEFALRAPDDATATITLTATVGEFKKLRAQLSQEWPSWELGRQIGDVILKAEERFAPDEEPQS